ncbi:aldehyde dehydrogenase family protein [Streptomyces sp. TRM75561]|uniref:aldehyde dehydrogenase family protein n=1 Tax=Streptomyces sp. TRM75561 TaxID=2975269 RepID=UPI002446FAC4|nr:aldehyde dehydrogenase family protein [Streptomyces sp. TRM75561]MDH3038924.1 aldehyde dehydrogenase family protein [Streptomyces sp. TRM75561]
MRQINQVYIDGKFVTPHGTELSPLFNPATEEIIGEVRLGDETDTHAAVAAAKRAFTTFSRTEKTERIAILNRLSATFAERLEDLQAAMVEEYGAVRGIIDGLLPFAPEMFDTAAELLESYEFTRTRGTSTVTMKPLGVAAVITPWNVSTVFIAQKVAHAIAAGATVVVKPSELSAIQTQIVAEAFHAADLPPGVVNIVTGRGDVVGNALTAHPDVAKVSFIGSTAVGQQIMRNAADTFKRLTLELGGKGPSIILNDADLPTAIPTALASGFLNNGQTCFAGTRILAPHSRLDEVLDAIELAMPAFQAGDPKDPSTGVGPVVSQKQFDRVQNYIRIGQEEGAQILTGGEGRPAGLDRGWFVKPTVFTGVTNQMRIAREEIFGPVLVVIPYKDDDEAVAIANDTPYGLQAQVFSTDSERAHRVAQQVEAGTVVINQIFASREVPFGGIKQSGIGREHGNHSLEAHLEPHVITA